MNSPQNIERAIAQLQIKTRSRTDKRILDDTSAALAAGLQKQPLEAGGERQTGWVIRIVRPALVAAAIMVGLALLFKVLPGTSPTLGDIHKAFAKAENTCISTFQAGQTEPFQQVWESQTLNVKLFKTGAGNQAQFTLWDVPIRVKMTKSPASDSVRTEAITDQMLVGLDESVVQKSRLFPFSGSGDVPANAQWSSMNQSQAAAAVPQTKVYEMAWAADDTSGKIAHRKCRFFVDTRTHLPRRVEWYAQSTPQDEYTFETFSVVSYPSASEIQELIQSTFGLLPGRPDEPEFIGTPGMDR